MPEISVIIPVYNTAKYLSKCLDSVIGQTFNDLEIICINDGSTDNSAEILNQYAATDSRIKIINQKNMGVVAARNNAIATACGKYIFPLDSDDFIAPNALELLYNAIKSKLGDIITCRVMLFGNQNQEMYLPQPTKYNMAFNNCLVNAALFRKSDFLKTGGYSTDFNIALEDYDLWLNFLFLHNKKIYRVPEILFFYRIKNVDESRNMQNKKKHIKLVRLLHKKYPDISKYIKSRYRRKITRFFFRIQDNKIKIFKIPIYKIKNTQQDISCLGTQIKDK